VITAFTEVVSATISGVRKRQQLIMANLTGNAFLLFVLYSWLSVPGQATSQLLSSIFVLVVIFFFAFWLHATTLAAFHPGTKETPFMAALERLPKSLPWLLALTGVVILFTWMSSVLSLYVWIPGVALILAILPMASQAAGGAFSRKSATDIIFSEHYWLIATALLVAGLYLPWLLFSWFPQPEDFALGIFATALRWGIAYFLAIYSWVLLAAVIGSMGARLEVQSMEEAAKAAISPPVSPSRRAAAYRFTPGTQHKY